MRICSRAQRAEVFQYNEVSHDCLSVIDNIWKLTRCISHKTEITVEYHRWDRSAITRRIIPIAILFSDYYFYLIAYHGEENSWEPRYYRVDRIVKIVEHREHYRIPSRYDFDEGELRSKIQFMQAGKYRKIRFSYEGESVQAILDRLPTARIVEVDGPRKIIEAETFGKGINMYLLSQGRKIRVLEPSDLVEEIKTEIAEMAGFYD